MLAHLGVSPGPRGLGAAFPGKKPVQRGAEFIHLLLAVAVRDDRGCLRAVPAGHAVTLCCLVLENRWHERLQPAEPGVQRPEAPQLPRHFPHGTVVRLGESRLAGDDVAANAGFGVDEERHQVIARGDDLFATELVRLLARLRTLHHDDHHGERDLENERYGREQQPPGAQSSHWRRIMRTSVRHRIRKTT